MKKLLASLVCVCCWITIAVAGPFGTEMGDRPEKFSGMIKYDDHYETSEVPSPHSLLKSYSLEFTKSSELFAVSGITALYLNDITGVEVQTAYDQLKKDLISKYGKPVVQEALDSRSSLRSNDQFSLGIYKKERTHSSFWVDGITGKLPDDLYSIALMIVTPRGEKDPAVILRYSYKNEPKSNTPKSDTTKIQTDQDAL